MRTDIGHDGRRGTGSARDLGCGLHLQVGMSFAEWTAVGRRLARVSSASAWALGDWLLFGERTYGRRYRAALQATDLDYQTLRNYAWVAGRFPPSRRHTALSFQHHAEVAALSEPEQELWLRRAEIDRWSRNELRRRLSARREAGRDKPATPVVMRFEVAPEAERRWRRAAASRRLDLQEWLRTVADAAASDELAVTRE